jgi:hypothetical protein
MTDRLAISFWIWALLGLWGGICDGSNREEFEQKHAEIAKNKGGVASRALCASVQNSSGFLIFRQLRLVKAVRNPLTKPEGPFS